MVHISRCKPINKDEQTNENQSGISQPASNNQPKHSKPPGIQTLEPAARYPLRSKGIKVNTLMMLTLVCLTNIVSGTNSYTQEYLQKTLGPGVMKEKDAAIIHYIGGKALIQLYTYQIAILSSIDPVASITVQILDRETLKTTVTISAAKPHAEYTYSNNV